MTESLYGSEILLSGKVVEKKVGEWHKVNAPMHRAIEISGRL